MSLRPSILFIIGLLYSVFQPIYATTTVSPLPQQALPPKAQAIDSFLYVERGDLKIKLGGRIKLDGYYDIDGKQPGSTFGLDPTTIPLKGVNSDAKRKGNFNYSLTGSRISFDVHKTYREIPIHGFLDIDFAGNASSTSNSYNPRLREAYAEFCGFRIGQTFTTFIDLADFTPKLDNIFSPPRQALVRYTYKITPKWTIAFAAERPNTEYYQYATEATSSVNNGYLDNNSVRSHSQSPMPDGTMQLKYKTGQGHFNVRGVIRQFKIKTVKDDNDALKKINKQITGWGLGVSVVYKITPGFELQTQINGGNGIGHYLDDIDNRNALACYFQYPAGYPIYSSQFEAVKMSNLMGGVVLSWTEKLKSSATASYTKIYAPKNISSKIIIRDFHRTLQRYLANLIYTLFPNTQVGIEILHYRRKAGIHTTHHGNDTRILSSFIYKF